MPNARYLQNKINDFGFEVEGFPYQQLEQAIANDQAEFQLEYPILLSGLCTAGVTVFFRRTENGQSYSVDRYRVKFRQGGSRDIERIQMFYTCKGMDISLKEACNLLQGRAINKDMTDDVGMSFNAWVQLNFEEKDQRDNYRFMQYGSEYGFNLEKAIMKYPIRELQTEQGKADLIHSLKKGNQPLVVFEIRQKEKNMLIAACPKYKTITILPVHLRKV